MSKHIISEKKASRLSGGIFLICLAFLAITHTWWPGIFIALGITIAFREFMKGKYYDTAMSIAVFGGLFTIFYLQHTRILLPVLLFIAGLYLFLKEYVQPDEETEEEIEDEIQHEIEENNE